MSKWKKLVESATKNIVENDAEDMAQQDHEVSMAKSQLLSVVKSATRIAKLLQGKSEEEGLEGWVASKLTMAEDYLQAVADHMDGQEITEGYKVLPPMDPKYVERKGLEGPFTTLSGKVVYYDSKEGSYYDPDTDMYISYDDFRHYDNDYKDMEDERDEVKEGIPKDTSYGVAVDGKYIAKGNKANMRRLAKNTEGGQLMNSPSKKVGDSVGKAVEEGGLRPGFAKELRNAELNKGKGPAPTGKTTGPDDYAFLKNKNKDKKEKTVSNEARSSASDEAAKAGAYNGGKSIGKSNGKAKSSKLTGKELEDFRAKRSAEYDVELDAARKANRDRLASYTTEEKTRLDPKCWDDKKIGKPATKMKNGVRVNNCVPK